ncbi:FG-GAP-like repeat-containing protein [uncultured Muribaculum sp.]|uniref:FG-GAP-like repeat-containing protein n=1 Tax=uncultured Muribaculum sp. TaxID=1918613 RepID=UPI0025F1BC47|nr:FG-GAP-like repeat-containing protein [uncultured Muribaculum sp.]
MKAYAFLCAMALCMSVHSMDFNPSDHLKGGKAGGVVGNIPMEIGVDNTGAATFSIPIELPQGCGGLTPELSINYNSMGGNGMFGRGTELSGVSAIYRTAATRFVNGYDRGVMFDSDDALCLDGQPIIRNTDNPLKYHCRIGDVYDITADNADNPTRFTLRDGNGITKEFGLTENSRMLGYKSQINTNTYVFAWLLEKVSDSNGNYYTITYKDINHTLKGVAIEKIEYSGNENAGVSPQMEVRFSNYGSDKGETVYHGGKPYWQKRNLHSIMVFVGGERIKKYEFSYSSGGDHTSSFLESVSLEGSEWGIRTNPIEFTWQHSSSGIKDPVRNTISGIGSSGAYFGDFNGDGLPDLLVTPTDNTSWKNFKYYLNDGNGGFSLKKEFDITLKGGINVLPNKTNKLVGTYVADFNGDGRDDVMFEGLVIGERRRMEIYLSDGNGFYDSAIDLDFTNDNARIIGDFNGDGAADIMFAVPGTTSAHFHISQLSDKMITPMALAFEAFVSEPWEEIQTGNFDGGHDTDIINLQKDSHICYAVNEEKRVLEIIHRGGFPTRSETHYLGDFNGDGMTDVVMTTYNGNKYLMREAPVMCLCTGTQFVTENMERYGTSVFRYDRKVLVTDVNGDGKDDFISIPNSNSYSNESILTLFSQGDGLRYYQDMYISSDITFADKCYYSMQDIYGEGKHTLFGLPHTDERISGEYLIYNERTPCENVITGISDCMGNTTEFQYERWTDYTNSPFIEVWEDYPYSGCSMAIPLVKKMSQSNGRGGMLTTLYEYKNARTHLGKMGFLGFKNVMTTKPEEKMVRNDNYMLDPDYGMLNVLSTIYTIDGQRLQMEKNVYDTQPSPAGTIMVQPVANARHSYSPVNLSNYLTVKTGRTYDKWGNILTERVTTNDKHKQITTYTYSLEESLHWMHRLASRQVETSVSGGDSHIEKETYLYAGSLSDQSLQTSRKSSYFDGNETHREEYGYDTFGNCDSTATGGIASSVRSIKRTYTPDGRLCVNEQMPMNYSKAYQYDNFGNPLVVSASDGLIDSLAYDSFGNNISTKKIGVTTLQGSVWSSNIPHNPDHGAYCRYTKYGSDPYRLTFFDTKGIKLRECYDMAGRTVAVDYAYDDLGRLLSESRPYYIDSEDKKLTNYTYDDFGNLVMTVYPNGYVQSMEYDYSIDGIAVTSTTEKGSTIQMHDHFNRLLWSENELGERVDYSYDAVGRCISADIDRQCTSFFYNIIGGTFQRTVQSQDFGTVNYRNDEFKQIKRSTRDYIGQTSYAYDQLGNVRVKSTPHAGRFSYNYFDGQPFCLAEVKDLYNTYFHFYDYDEYNRIKEEILCLYNEFYGFSYKYDNNKIKEFTYPNGLKLSYEYSGDIVVCIRNTSDNTVIWKADSLDASGRPISCSYGDSITAYYQYDLSTGGLLKADYGSILSILYTRNNRGIIDSRREGPDFYEYGYDKLNRLSSVSHRFEYVIDHPFVPGYPIEPGIPRDSLVVRPLSFGSIILPKDTLSHIAKPIYDNKNTYRYDSQGNISAIVQNDTVGITYRENSTHIYSNELDSAMMRWNRLTMSAINRIDTISNDSYSLALKYGSDNIRFKSVLMSDDSTTITRDYVSTYYEVIKAGGKSIPICYIYANDRLVALQAQGHIYYVLTDHLGSVMRIVDGEKNVVASYSYSEWGKRYVGTLKTEEHPWVKYFNRGFCGHEHLPEFSLINMGARVYDPVDMRFLSPDPLVQNPALPQNFNRYSYCLNNPINYTDPNGEFFIIDDFIVGFFSSLVTGHGLKTAVREGARRSSLSIKLLGGLFKTGYKHGFWNRTLELFSRFTWQLPQTLLGYEWAAMNNTFGCVDDVQYYGGTTVVTSKMMSHSTAVTMGNYIVGGTDLEASPYNSLFQHEYGHYLQSQKWGPLWINAFGVPSLVSMAYDKVTGKKTHKWFYTEIDANKRAYKYFSERIPGYQFSRNPANQDGWYIDRHPIHGRSSIIGENNNSTNGNLSTLINLLNIR